MSSDSQSLGLLSEGIVNDNQTTHLDEINDSAVINVSCRDRRFLAQLDSDNQLDVEPVGKKQVRITSTGYVGVVAIPDGDPIHIEPKLTGTPLLRLLQYSGATNIQTIEQEAAVKAGTDYVGLLAILFADELDAVRRQGISQTYQSVSETEEYIRGRLNIYSQLQQRGPASPQFECTYDELTQDSTLNQTILFGTYILMKATSEENTQQRLWKHIQELQRSVTLRRITQAEARSIHLTRLNSHYDDLLRLAKLVIQHIYIEDVAPGGAAGYTMLLQMYEQFEAVVETAVTAAASDYTVKTGSNAELQNFLNGDFAIAPKPDIIVQNTAGDLVLVLDAKWKDGTNTAGEWSPARNDIYQMLSYQQHTGTAGVLVFPSESGGELGTAKTNSGQKLWLAGLPVESAHTSEVSFSEYRTRLNTSLESVINQASGEIS